VAPDDALNDGLAALEQGRWSRACDVLATLPDDPRALAGWASALWWLGENDASVERWTCAYTGFRRTGDDANAAQCAISLAIVYKANYADHPVADGWLARAERLLAHREVGTLHAWLWIARGYRANDLDSVERLIAKALAVARTDGDVDLELVALSQLGKTRVGQGRDDDGFALLDVAGAAGRAGPPRRLDTVAYTCSQAFSMSQQV